MAVLTPTAVPAAGLAIALVAANSSDNVAATDNMWLHVKNGGAGSITVSISDTGSTPAGNAGTVVAQTITAGAERLIALSTRNNAAATGLTTITYSGVTTVTAAVFVR